MRTTLTLESELERKLKEIAARKRMSFKDVVNETLRAGLKAGSESESEPFRVKAHNCGFRSGIDSVKLNQLSDELQIEDFVAERSGNDL
jgi:predicted DNA-binding ribbon-helix-helix protein